MLTLTIIFFVSLFFSGLFSMLEAAVISQDKHRLSHLAEEGHRNAVVMSDLLNRTDKLLGAILLCNNLANIACATTATTLVTSWIGTTEISLLAVTFIVTFIILVCSEITPKVIGVKHAQKLSLLCAKPLRALLFLLAPFIHIANFFSNQLLFLLRQHQATTGLNIAMSTKELRSVVRAASRAHKKEDTTKDEYYAMVDKTLRFKELTVEKIMTPRPDVEFINLAKDSQIIDQEIRHSRFSKLPIVDGNIDNVKGIIHTHQAMLLRRDKLLSSQQLLTIKKNIHYVPAAAMALQQLLLMRRQQENIALVLDGSGRIVGLLTITDFANAIIGNSSPHENILQKEGGAVEIDADTPLIQLETLQPRLILPNTTATNLNGLILEYLGDLPDAPLCLLINGCRLEITALDDKSVRKVRLLPAPATLPTGNDVAG